MWKWYQSSQQESNWAYFPKFPTFSFNKWWPFLILLHPFSNRSMSAREHLGDGAQRRQLLGGVGRGATGGVLHCFHQEGRRDGGLLQHHRNHVPILLHVRLHLPHHRLPLQPGRLQPNGPRPQLHHQLVFILNQLWFALWMRLSDIIGHEQWHCCTVMALEQSYTDYFSDMAI